MVILICPHNIFRDNQSTPEQHTLHRSEFWCRYLWVTSGHNLFPHSNAQYTINLHKMISNRSAGTALKVVPNIPQRFCFTINECVRVIHELSHAVSKHKKQFFLLAVTDECTIIKYSMLLDGEL